MPVVLLATCEELPAGDEDAQLLGDALAGCGVDGRWAVWNDPSVDWSAGLVVLRSTWDYTYDRAAFLGWIDALPRVLNGPEVVRWNTDKVYLADLVAAGVPTVDTAFAAPGEAPVFAAEPAEFVVKPSVGAGSRGAGRFTADRLADARTHVEALHAAGRTAMVQPYLEAVDTAGETSLIYVDGRFSHAISKGAMLPPGVAHPVHGHELFVAERIEACAAQPAELAVGTAVMDVVRARFGDQLYARVDLLPTEDGPLLVELELTEPSLFVQHGSGENDPAAVFAAAIAARV
jgi:glutathione synthase/RimK-type ligase-like ATP-grasp enzyme